MSGQTSPPGDSFAERWPDDAAEREYLAGPWIPVVLGGAGGLFGVPLILAGLTTSLLIPMVLVLGATLLATTLLVRRSAWAGGRGQMARRVWKIAAWLALMTVLGVVVVWLVDAVCPASGACITERLGLERNVAQLVTVVGLVGGSILGAIEVDRIARRLGGPRRAAAPR
jgi:hypothetical protein